MTKLAKNILEESQNERAVMDYLMKTAEQLEGEQWENKISPLEFFELVEGVALTVQSIYLNSKTRRLQDAQKVIDEA